jgi:hypothetical protein
LQIFIIEFEAVADADVEVADTTKEVYEGDAGQISASRMVLESSVTDAPRANTPPLIVEPPFIVTEATARMFPIKPVPIPIVALLPTFQKTVPEDPPVIITDAATAVVTVLPI